MTLSKGSRSRVGGPTRTATAVRTAVLAAPWAGPARPAATSCTRSSLSPVLVKFCIDAGRMPADAAGPGLSFLPDPQTSSADAARPVTPTGGGRAPRRRNLKPATEMAT